MPYDIDSEGLFDYSIARLSDLTSRGRGRRIIGVEKLDDKRLKLFKFKAGSVITHEHDGQDLEHLKGDYITLEPSISRRGDNDIIEITIEPHKAGINGRDVCGFLEGLINGDQIFSRESLLFSQDREKNIDYWRSILKRDYDKCKSKLSCIIIDKDVGTKNLKKAYYEYMLRPSMCYLIGMGSFSSKS